MRNRHSLVVGSAVFAVLIMRLSLPGTDRVEGATLQATAFVGVVCGVMVTLVAFRKRWRVAGAHVAVLAPALVALAILLVAEDVGGRGAGGAVVELMARLREAVENGALRLEDLVIFAVAFWTIAAFFINAVVSGTPRIAFVAPLVAALAVTVIDPAEASSARIAGDVALVASVLVAAALDERSLAAIHLRPVTPRLRRRSWLPYPALTVTFAVASLAGALLVTPAVSALGPSRRGFPVAGGGDGPGRVDHFADIHQDLTELSSAELFTVEYDRVEDAEARLRLLTLPEFAVDGFFPGDPGSDTWGQRLVGHEVTIRRPFDDRWLPAVAGAMSVTAGTIVPGGVAGSQAAGLSYRVASRPADPASPQGEVAPPPTAMLGLDGIADLATVRAVAERIATGTVSDLAAAVAIERHLRAREYRLPETRTRVDLTAWIVDDSASGYCEQFSVAMAVLARSLGMPSRVVLGFLPGDVAGATVTVRGSDAHAWVEVWIEDLGWLPFDPTPGARSGLRSPGDAYETLVLAGDPQEEAAAEEQPPEVPTATPEGRGLGLTPLALAASVLLAGLVGIAIVAARGRSSLRRRAEAGDVVAAWDTVVDRLTVAGMPPAPWFTPLEIARATTPTMAELASGYTKQAYGTALLDDVETAAALESMRLTEAELRAATPAMRRMIEASGVPALRRRLRPR